MNYTDVAPLPPLNMDPAFLAAQGAAATYTATAAAVRGDFTLSAVGKAQLITQAWADANAAISKAWVDLTNRRQERLSALEALVPLGPNVPANATPAEESAMYQAFREALASARVAVGGATSDAGIQRLLKDAERFGDETLGRAALTAATDAGMVNVIREWCARVGISAELDELLELRSTLAGNAELETRLWQSQAFRLVAEPAESHQLPGLLAAAGQAKADAARAANPSRNWH